MRLLHWNLNQKKYVEKYFSTIPIIELKYNSSNVKEKLLTMDFY